MKGSSNVLLTTLHSCPLRRSVSPISGGGCCVNASISKSPFGYRISNRRPGMCAAFPTPEARNIFPRNALRALALRKKSSPSRWRFRPPAPVTVRFRVEPPGRASTYSRSVLGATANLVGPWVRRQEALAGICRTLRTLPTTSTSYALDKRCFGSKIALRPQPGRLRRCQSPAWVPVPGCEEGRPQRARRLRAATTRQ